MSLSDLPALNATLNATSAVLLLTGYAFIRRGHVRRHRAAMISACVVSTLFLTSYVIYHANAGSKPFTGHGAIRALYFTILLTHVVLAAAVPPLALITLWRAKLFPENSAYVIRNTEQGWAQLDWFLRRSVDELSSILV